MPYEASKIPPKQLAYRNGYRAGKVARKFIVPEKYIDSKDLKDTYTKGYDYAFKKFEGKHTLLRAEKNARETAKRDVPIVLKYPLLRKKYGKTGAKHYINTFQEYRKKKGFSSASVLNLKNSQPVKELKERKFPNKLFSNMTEETQIEPQHHTVRAEHCINPTRICIHRNITSTDNLKRQIIAGLTKRNFDSVYDESKGITNSNSIIPNIDRKRTKSNIDYLKHLIVNGLQESHSIETNVTIGNIFLNAFKADPFHLLEQPSRLTNESYDKELSVKKRSCKK